MRSTKTDATGVEGQRQSTGSGRFAGIQALRFLAALLVVVTHSTLYAHDRLDPSTHIWRLGGTVGVEMFFGVSGFVMVVSSASLVNRSDGWKFFAMRRLVRIVPMYWIATTVKVLALVLASSVVLHASLEPFKVLLSYVFLPSRNVDGAVEPLLGVGWTLIFEMFFYLVFGVALRVRARVVPFCGVVLALCSLGYLLRGDDWALPLFYLNPIVLNFLVGMMLGRWVLCRRRSQLVVGLGVVMALWAAIDVVQAVRGYGLDWADLVRHVGVVAVLVAAVCLEPWLARWLPKLLVRQGDASYSLYLFHPLLAPAVPAVLARLGIISVPLSIALSLVAMPIAAALIYAWSERVVTRWLQDRLPFVRVHPAGVIESTV